MAKKFRCTVCGYIHEGNEAPERCPLCKVPADKFVEIEEQSGSDEIFDLYGRKLNDMPKSGIVIKNNRKIYIK
mgnify:CR=1 FL=1